jgi:conjugal transfer mating pair stabilization protein TraN
MNATIIPGTTTYECPSGYTLSGTSCIATTQRIENKTGSYTCPSGYTISADKLRCTSTVNATRTSTSGSTTCNCPYGYRDNGGNCVRTYNGSYHAGSTNYGNCPSGWNASGSQCTKAANATRSWSNPGNCTTSSRQLSEYENSSSKRVKTGQNCTARGCTYTYCTYTAITNYSCPQGNRNGSTCYIARPSSTSNPYYTCNDGRTQSSSTCYEYANKNCSTTPGSTSYSCPSGYNLNSNNTCTRTVNSTYNSSTTYSCPVGYTMSGTQCIKTTPATPHTSETQYTCPTGYVREGTTCYQYTTPTTKKTYAYECPTGYKKEGEGENTKCSIYVEDKTTYYCESAEEQLVDDKCIKTIKGGLKGYSCPDGYILDKDKCIKHSLECTDPIPVTSTSTTYEYKWSSEPSLDGWTPTGKTRGTATEENLYDK